jgi:tetratricopeptide (TPR) repeat protein
MKNFMAWLATAATLSFALPVNGSQDHPQLDELFEALKSATSEQTAAPLEAHIWLLWTASGSDDIDRLMTLGAAALGARDFDTADAAFTTIVEKAPGFAEGWNKRATLYYMMGALDRSTSDVEKTLILEPRHFGALSGLGLIRLAQDDEAGALEAFERALLIHPHMAGATTHIRELRDKLKGRAI